MSQPTRRSKRLATATAAASSTASAGSIQEEAKRKAAVKSKLQVDADADSKPANDTALSSALSTGKALMLLQLMSRLLTFALNQALVRLAPPSVFGTAAIQFDLVAATILFLSREGVRTALLRSYTSSAAALARWPLRLGVLVATGTATLYLSTSAASTTSQPYFAPALALYVFASLTELAVEPLYIRALTATPPRLRVRVQAEGGMAITRAVVSCAALVLGPPDSALLGFALGHAAGSVWLAARYVVGFGLESVRGLFVASAEEGEEGAKPDPATRDLVIANTRQSVVKHVLTEADRIAVGQLAELGDQGGYAVAMNYGSLVARIVFQPVEETLQLHWSRTGAGRAVPLLALALRLSLHLALLLPVFLPPILPAVLPLLLPRQYTAETTAAATLQTYLVAYLPIMSLNGILESFHTATARPEQVARQAKFMAASSAAFALSLLLMTRGRAYIIAHKLAPTGDSRLATAAQLALAYTTEQALIYASCTAMLVRIGYAYAHARSHAAAHGQAGELSLAEIVPRAPVRHVVLAAGGALWFIATRAGDGLRGVAILLASGAIAGVTVLATIYLAEKEAFRRVGAAEREKENKGK